MRDYILLANFLVMALIPFLLLSLLNFLLYWTFTRCDLHHLCAGLNPLCLISCDGSHPLNSTSSSTGPSSGEVQSNPIFVRDYILLANFLLTFLILFLFLNFLLGPSPAEVPNNAIYLRDYILLAIFLGDSPHPLPSS